MKHLDDQMQRWAPRLRDDVPVSIAASNALATALAEDVLALPIEVRTGLAESSPVGLRQRLDELRAFQGFMDSVGAVRHRPEVTRAQVILQNYMCFVYLGDACFKLLRRDAPTGSTLKSCCRFLTNNPVRAFRNAVAHGNWQYAADFSGLVYWARKGDDPDEPLVEFQVAQLELDFWQSLARCTAYAVYTELELR